VLRERLIEPIGYAAFVRVLVKVAPQLLI
jgi:hypothetical protein